MSAFAAIRALRDDLEARLGQNEDFRAFVALEKALRDIAATSTMTKPIYSRFMAPSATPDTPSTAADPHKSDDSLAFKVA